MAYEEAIEPTVDNKGKNGAINRHITSSPAINSSKEANTANLPSSNTEKLDRKRPRDVKPSADKENGINKLPRVSTAALEAQHINKYEPNARPPFAVHTQHTDSNENVNIHPLNINKILTQIARKDIIEIKKIGKNKILAEFRSYEAANKLVENPILSLYKLKAIVPSYKTIRNGIIKDIPQDIDLKTIGQILPKHIALYKVRREVYPYIPKVRMCYNCYRVGHVSKACRSKPRCRYCGSQTHKEEEECEAKTSPPRYINCKDYAVDDHDSAPNVRYQPAVITYNRFGGLEALFLTMDRLQTP